MSLYCWIIKNMLLNLFCFVEYGEDWRSSSGFKKADFEKAFKKLPDDPIEVTDVLPGWVLSLEKNDLNEAFQDLEEFIRTQTEEKRNKKTYGKRK